MWGGGILGRGDEGAQARSIWRASQEAGQGHLGAEATGEYVFHSAWGGGSQGGLGSEVTPELTLENDHPGCYTRHGARGREATAGKHAHPGGETRAESRWPAGGTCQSTTVTGKGVGFEKSEVESSLDSTVWG